MLPMSVEKLAEAKVALDRLNQFVAIAESEEEVRRAPSDSSHAIVMRRASFRWGASARQECLKRIDTTVIKQEVTALIGRVGCGKTSFLAGVLGEAQLCSGTVDVISGQSAPIAYVPQQPWIVAGTIRDNILMGQPFDTQRYNKVCFACALETDLNAMPAGDMTEIGGAQLTSALLY
jgi:ATP-binding cassette subfamily C (CFTR/MRP) protein 1